MLSPRQAYTALQWYDVYSVECTMPSVFDLSTIRYLLDILSSSDEHISYSNTHLLTYKEYGQWYYDNVFSVMMKNSF